MPASALDLRLSRSTDNEAPRIRLSRRNVVLGVASVLTVAAISAAAGWAGARVFAPRAPIEDASFTLVTIESGSVGGLVAVNARARWAQQPAAINRTVGTVTSVEVSSARVVDPGEVLYTVDLQPVVVMAGTVPAFRSMSSGTAGEDVAQLQRFLTSSEYFSGDADGVFDAALTSAVRAWQADTGLTIDGSVDLGEVVFANELPSRLIPDQGIISVGAQLGGGEPAVLTVGDSPVFSIPVTDTQARAIPDGTRVELSAPDGTIWQARVQGQQVSDDGAIDLLLESEGAGPICAEQCETVPLGDGLLLPSRAITAETVEGLVVPSAAVLTQADGTTVVIDANGVAHEVSVLAGARGLTAIEGVETGLRVRAPAEMP